MIHDGYIVDILGTGPSLKHYRPVKDHGTIGVNDIFRYHPVHTLLVLDRPDRFTKERQEIIINSRPRFFVTDIDLWHVLYGIKIYDINAIIDKTRPGYPDCLDKIMLPRHVDSTYTAIGFAYIYLCPETIILHGVDLRDHPDLKHYWPQIREAYIRMHRYLGKNNVNLFVGHSDSPLSEIIPVYHD